MSELQTQANMCESCAWDREAEYYVPDEGNMCSGCYAAYEEEREKAHTCDECGKIQGRHCEDVSEDVKMCEDCEANVDRPNKNKEVTEKGWIRIISENSSWKLMYYAFQAKSWETSPVREVLGHVCAEYSDLRNSRLQRLDREFAAYVSDGNPDMAKVVLKDIREYIRDKEIIPNLVIGI